MNRLISMIFALAVAAMPLSALSAVTADFSFKVLEHPRGGHDKLQVSVRMHGIEKGEVFKYGFRWTSPSEVFEDSEYIVEGPAGDPSCVKSSNPNCNCYCADTKEKGCWRSRAHRTIEWTSKKGKRYRATGKWIVELFRIDVDSEGNEVQSVIGRSEYRVR